MPRSDCRPAVSGRVVRLNKDQRPEVVVPDEREDEDRHAGDCRAHERRHDAPENRQLADALDPRGIERVVGNVADEVAHEQRAEPGLERHVEQDERPARVVESQCQHEVPHRDHQRLEGEEIAADERHQQDPVAPELVFRKSEPRHRREHDRADDGRNRHQETVEDELRQARVEEHGRIVVEEPRGRRPPH